MRGSWHIKCLVEIVIFRRIHKTRNNNIPHFSYRLWSSPPLVNLRLHPMSQSLARPQRVLLLYYRERERERETKAWGSEMICPDTQGVNTILKNESSFPGFCRQWPVTWDILSHFLVLVTWLGVTFRDDGGFYWKHLILSEKSQKLTCL